jgi:hypothetical protein
VKFAEGTTVAPEKTRGEIERLVKANGGTRFAFGYLEDRAGVSFVAHGLLVRFTIPNPTKDDKAVRERMRRTRLSLQRVIDEEERRRWRCLLLAIKSKFTTVDSEIETFEEAFLANIVTTDNITVYERIKLENSGVRFLPPVQERHT